MSHTDPSFPRGRAAAAPSTDAPAAADAARHKRRRGGTDADSSAAYIKGQSATPTTKTTTKEFLFGSTEDDEANQQRLSSKRSRSASKDLTQENSRLSMYSKSLLPLGGGGCVVSGSSKQQQHQMGEGYIEPLQFTKFSPGFKLLAVVKQVTADLAVFSLPNLWTAYMLRSTTTGSSPPLDDCLQVDQVLAVTVVKAVQESTPSGPKRRIQVTCDPARVNPVDLNVPAATSGGGGVLCRGMIVSVQDHGLLLDLGLQRRGFLPFAEIQGDYYTTTTAASPEEEEEDSGATKGHGDGTRRLTVYRLVDCVVRGKTSTSGIVPLSLPEHIHTVTLPLSYKPALTDLIPGTLITNVTVEQAMKNGLAVTFGSGSAFRGAIELPHTGTYWVPDDNNNNINISKPKGGELTAWRQFFEEHRSLGPARVLAVDPRTKLIRLTLLPHLLALKSPKNDRLPSTGTVVSNCTVIRIDPGLGALLALPDDSIPNHTSDLPVVGDNQKRPIFKPLSDDAAYAAATRVRAVFVHISKASDETEDGKISDSRFAKQFGPTTKHTVRIVSTDNRIEGIASGATALSIVSAHVLTHADLVAGQVYKQVPVCGQLPNNQDILIDFGLGIRGLIPALHLFDQTVAASDFRNKMIKVKYAVGAKVDVRVLSVDLKTKKCLVTAKKSLVKAESIITSYDEAVSGQITTGYVSKVDDSGLYVTFFNGVFGRVTARSLSADLGVENLYENYSRGDVVQCRVLHMKKRMKTQRSLSSRSRWQLEEDDDLATEIDNEHDDRSRFHYELTLSLRLDHAKNATDDHVERLPSKIDLSAGFILPLKSLRVVELVPGKTKVNDTRFIPGYAIVSIKSKYMVGEAEAASMPLHMDCKLPYDQLLDQYNTDDIADAGKLDEFATRILTIGKKINRKGFLLSDPKKSNTEYLSGTGQLPVLSIRPILVQTVEMQQNRREGEPVIDSVTLPSPSSSFFVGALVQGYVTSLDSRYGAFVRFLDGLTGLVPKVKNGLRLQQYSTVIVKIVAVDDKFSPPKILLGLSGMPSRVKEPVKLDRVDVADIEDFPFKSGDTINAVEITKVDFHRAHVCVLDRDWSRFNGVVQAQIHFTMVEVQKSGEKNSVKPGKLKRKGISSCHPFYSWEKGMKLTELRVLTVERHGEKLYVGITNRVKDEIGDFYIKDADKLSPGDRVTGIVTGVSKNQGLWVELSPTVSAHVPGLEVSTDVNVLNNLQKHFPLGASLDCVVMDKLAWEKTRFKYQRSRASKHAENSNRVIPFLSVLACAKNNTPSIKPLRGDLVVGRIDRKLATANPPDLMLDLRGGFVGRCCITELDEVDDWTNFPLGRIRRESDKSIETTNDTLTEEKAKSADDSFQRASDIDDVPFANGMFVQCRVLAGTPSKPVVEVSLRQSRLEGDLDDDVPPEKGNTIQAYVVETSSKGCFLRISRQVEGRTILKELCDGFLPNPSVSFPTGRLVVGKVKQVNSSSKKIGMKLAVDVDMRESTLVTEGKVSFEDIEIGSKYNGTVTRIEDYGVFVRLESSDVSGLVHKSECSDNYIKSLTDLYDPGDLVKLLVLKKNDEKKQLGFSMKASNFINDDDSDVESHDSGLESGGIDIDMDDDVDDIYVKRLTSTEYDDAEDSDANIEGACDGSTNDTDENSVESDEEEGDDEDLVMPSSSKGDANAMEAETKNALDTNVGFDWIGTSLLGDQSHEVTSDKDLDSDADESEIDDDDDDGVLKSSHKSRKKQAQRRKEEEETNRLEMSLADGTADENPETAADFERLLAGDPNSSELWIRYMAFHLTLANIPTAREVAERAFARIEFRQEKEKLNVWSALLTLEYKYGNDETLQKALDRACQHNNPKYVYLRVCEMMEKQAATPESIRKTDEMFAKMCKKFKSKKKVWIANMEYMLKNGRQEEAYEISKRALLSLKQHKHIETMSKFAQLVFQYGRAEKARTLFDGLLMKYPKRLDLFFVYVDKELKFGDLETARSLYARIASPTDEASKMKLGDKQMKLYFKKWFNFEQMHGDEESQERVKSSARAYVENST